MVIRVPDINVMPVEYLKTILAPHIYRQVLEFTDGHVIDARKARSLAIYEDMKELMARGMHRAEAARVVAPRWEIEPKKIENIFAQVRQRLE